MTTLMPFIGRKEELQKIGELINGWGDCQVLCIDGKGGVGKTRLLEEVCRQFGQKFDRLLIPQIIDFDDRALQVVENIERQIMESLSTEAFEDYSQQLHDWYKMKAVEVSAETLAEKDRQVRQTVVENFNRLSAKYRVVLLMDTLEKLEATNAWRRLTDLMLQVNNALFIMAGRNTKELYKILCHSPIKASLIELGPLGLDSSQEYLAEKQHHLSITLDKTLAENLLLLTQGRPILIDLAVEWLSRNIPFDWVTAKFQPDSLTPAELEKRRQDFQIQLVAHIGQIRTQMDRLILLMARVYPVDSKMIVKALNLSENEAEALLNQAKTYVFVKSYSSGRQIYLHDEMRRMVRSYVWPEIDPDGERRYLDSQFAVAYLTTQADDLAQEIKDLTSLPSQENTAQAEIATFVKRQALEQELWALREQLLFHNLFVNTEEGVNLFIDLFDQATREYQYSFREILLKQMRGYSQLTEREKYLKPLSSAQVYEVDIRESKFLLDSGRYDEAEKLLCSLLSQTQLKPVQQVDTCIQMANVVLRLGKFDQSIHFFQEAVNISKRHDDLQNWLVKAENGLGWAYRHTANREKAREHYEAALPLAKKLNLKHDQALLYSNLGFIYVYIPTERHKASSFCKASLRLWEEEGDKRGIGRAYSALGCVTFMEGKLDESLNYFQQALDIFEPVNDREWLSTVYSWRAAVYMSTPTRELDQAEKDLLQSLKMNIKKDRPMNLSRLGLLYLMQGNLEKGREVIKECRALTVELRDVLYQLISIRDQARLARHEKNYSQLEILEGYLKDYLTEWGDPQDRRALGMLYLEFGNLALGQVNVDRAINYYQQGLGPLAQLDRYGSDTIEVHIRRLEKFFVDELAMEVEQIRTIGTALQSFWEGKGFDVIYPNVSIDLEKWATWEGA